MNSIRNRASFNTPRFFRRRKNPNNRQKPTRPSSLKPSKILLYAPHQQLIATFFSQQIKGTKKNHTTKFKSPLKLSVHRAHHFKTKHYTSILHKMKTSKLKTSDPESKLSRKSLQHRETKPTKKQFKLKMQHTEQSIHREQTYKNKQCLGSEVTRQRNRWVKFEMEKQV